MRNVGDDIQKALEAINAGQVEGLTAEQVARTEAVVNGSPELASSLAGRKPPPLEGFGGPVRPPSDQDWDEMWGRIATRGQASKTTRPQILRLFRPLAAAAAAVIAVGLWNADRGPTSQPWPVEWTHNVEIEALDANEGVMPLVLAAGGGESMPVIWVLPSEDES